MTDLENKIVKKLAENVQRKMTKYYGRSELVEGRIMWGIYCGDGSSFPRDWLVAYFELHKDAIEYIQSKQGTIL